MAEKSTQGRSRDKYLNQRAKGDNQYMANFEEFRMTLVKISHSRPVYLTQEPSMGPFFC